MKWIQDVGMLKMYTKQKIRVLGKTNGKVNHKRQEKTPPIIAVKDTGPN